MAEIDRARLVTLTGPGGSGKTRLAEAASGRLMSLDRRSDFIDLSAIEDAGIVGRALMASLRVDEVPNLHEAAAPGRRSGSNHGHARQAARAGGRTPAACVASSVPATDRIRSTR